MIKFILSSQERELKKQEQKKYKTIQKRNELLACSTRVSSKERRTK